MKNVANLRPEIVYSMVKSYINSLSHDEIPKGSFIEFPCYGAIETLPVDLVDELKATAKAKGVGIIWTPEGDVFDFSPKKTLEGALVDPTVFEQCGRMVCFGAGDAMSWIGNEKRSASVEAMMGNNSNLRLVMNWWANPHIL